MTGDTMQPVELNDVPLQQRVSFRLQRVGILLTTQAGALLKASCGLTLNQWRLMTFLSERDSGSVSDLAKIGYVDKATLSRVAAELVKRGLILSEVSAKDRRAAVLRLSNEGHEVLAKAAPAMQHRQADLLAAITSAEKVQLFEILNKLEAAIVKSEVAPGVEKETE